MEASKSHAIKHQHYINGDSLTHKQDPSQFANTPSHGFVTKGKETTKGVTQEEDTSSDWDSDSETGSDLDEQSDTIQQIIPTQPTVATFNDTTKEDDNVTSVLSSTAEDKETPGLESPTSDLDSLGLDDLELDILSNYYVEPEPEPVVLDSNSTAQSNLLNNHHSNNASTTSSDVIPKDNGHIHTKRRVPTEYAMDFFRGSFADDDDDDDVEENRVSTLTRSFNTFSTVPMTIPLAALTMNMSFAGCGFLGIYHLGVAHTLAHHGHKLMLNVQKFGGASAGSLVASALAIRGTDKQVIEECIEFCYNLAETVQRKKLGVLTPRLCLLKPLKTFLDTMLPPDAHLIAKSRLFISVTDATTKKNHLVSEYDSKEQLIQYLLGSSYVPFVTGKKPVKVDGQKYLDGGMTDNLPTLPGGRTIYVTPFSGRQDICPVDKAGKGWYINIQGEDFQVNKNNLKRGLHAFFPPKRKDMDIYFQRGKNDAIRFLKKEHFYSEEGTSKNCERSNMGASQKTRTVSFEDNEVKETDA